MPRRTPWPLLVQSIAAAMAVAALFIHLFILQPVVPNPWATASDLEQIPSVNERLMIVLVDGMNPDRAFDPSQMPFVAGHIEQAAWGYARPQIPTLTGTAITTLGTGKWTALVDAIYNFSSPRARSDSLFRRLDDAGIRAGFFGDASWPQRFGPWADDIATFQDRGIYDTHESDQKALIAFERWLNEGAPHPVAVLHLVGADHAGHQHGTLGDGPYAQRLRALDKDLARLLPRLPPGTAVLIISDHGMTPVGGHGGGADGTRDAPFLWWGPGVIPQGPVSLDQSAIAPTLAGYLGVPPPAEAASPPATKLMALSPEDAARLERNATRQWKAVSTHPDGSPMNMERPWRGVGWALLFLAGLLPILSYLSVGSARETRLRSLLPALCFPAALWLPPIGVGALGVLISLSSLALMKPDWRTIVRGLPRTWMVLALSLLAATLPIMRWWGWHAPLYGLILLVAIAAFLITVPSMRKNPLIYLALSLSGVLFYVLWCASEGQYWGFTPDGAWGYLPILLLSVFVLRPVDGWRALLIDKRPPVPERFRSLSLFAAALLLLGAFLQRDIPHGFIAKAIVFAAPWLIVLVAWRAQAINLVGALLLGCAILMNDAQLSISLIVAGIACALSTAPTPKKFDARFLLAPLLMLVFEAAGFLALGKEYSFSSVQVAVAFTGDVELSLIRAIFFVALGDAFPWIILCVCVGAWAARSAEPLYYNLTLATIAAVMVTRLWIVVVSFIWIERSFWLTSSALPFFAETVVLIAALPIAFALSSRSRMRTVYE